MNSSPAKRMPRDDRRQQIIGKAIEVFGTKGYKAATTAELARQAEISEALLYQHFPSKQALLVAVIDHVGQLVYDGLQQILAATRDPSVTLRSLSDAFRSFSDDYPQITQFSIALSTEFEDPETVKSIRRVISRSADLLARAIKNGQKHAIIRADIDPEAIAWMVVSWYQTYGFLDRIGISEKMESQTVMQLMTPFLEPDAA